MVYQSYFKEPYEKKLSSYTRYYKLYLMISLFQLEYCTDLDQNYTNTNAGH